MTPEAAEPTTTPDRPRRLDRRSRWLIGLTVVAIVLLLFYAAYRHALRRSIDAGLQAIRDAGYPATATELDDWHPMPEGLNACAVILNGVGKIDVTEAQHEMLPTSGMGSYPNPPDPVDPNTLDVIESLVDANREGFAELHRATKIAHSRVPVSYSDGVMAKLPVFGAIREAANMLAEEAMLYAERGTAQQATDSVVAALHVGSSMNNECALLSHLVRAACNSLALDTLERYLHRAPMRDGQLARIDKALQLAECPDALFRSLVGERIYAVEEVFNLAARSSATPSVYGDMIGVDPNHPAAKAFATTGLADLDALSSLAIFEQAIDAALSPPHQQAARMAAVDAQLQAMPRWRSYATRGTISTTIRSAEIFIRDLAEVRAARLAVAIRRYQLAHGDLPEELDDLVPQFLDAVLLDPFTGNAMQYIRTETGYTVYSVNNDGNDDGGVFPTGTQGAPGTDIGMFIQSTTSARDSQEEPSSEGPTTP